MNLDLAEYGLGVASLFPLLASIEELRGFFPPRRRAWFVTLSTVFSEIVFITIATSFDSLRFYVPVLLTGGTGVGLLIVYVVIILATDRAEVLKDRRLMYGIVFGLLLVLYTTAIALLTYSFNVPKQFHEFAVYRGRVVEATTKKTVEGAGMSFVLLDQSNRKTSTHRGGRFVMVVPAGQLSAIRIDFEGKLCGTSVGDDVPVNESVDLIVEPCPGG